MGFWLALACRNGHVRHVCGSSVQSLEGWPQTRGGGAYLKAWAARRPLVELQSNTFLHPLRRDFLPVIFLVKMLLNIWGTGVMHFYTTKASPRNVAGYAHVAQKE